MIKLAR